MKFTFQPESRPLAGYTLKRGIARGGFGEVYYALSDAGKEVAVKLLQHHLDIELRGIQQCLNLRHPNLITIFDVKTDADGDQWVVMEYIGGQTLEQALEAQKGPMPIEQIECWLVGLAGGLGHLHDRGIVHRDVKPGNIFWDQGAIKLGDIGLSKFMTPSRRSAHTESVGTVYYMAPEVSYGKYGYEVDIYSVGIMLYEMLSGQLPFDGQSTGEILMKHLSEPPDLSRVPSQYRSLLAAALEKDPKKRTNSMAKFLEDFRRAKTGGPIPVQSFRTSGVAGAGAPPGFNASANSAPRPRSAPAAQAVRVGVWAANLADVFGLDPIAVQAWIATLQTRCLAGAMIIVGIWFMMMALYFLVNLLPMMVSWAAVMLVMLVPIGAVALLTSRTCRRWLGSRLNWGRNVPPEFIPTARPVAQVSVPPVAVRPTTPTPVSQVVAVRPMPYGRGSQRLAELSRSLSWATVLSILFGAGTGFLSPLFGDSGTVPPDIGKLGLFTITTILAVWAILIVSKFTSGSGVAVQYRRLLSFAAGAAVGCVAWWLSRLLMVDMAAGTMQHEAFFQALGRQPLVVNHEPTWLAFALFFGLLFEVRRWWCHVDADRPAMFSVGSVVLTVGVAAVLPVLFYFPWDWAVTWAAVILCVVQLSAAWIPFELRSRVGQSA